MKIPKIAALSLIGLLASQVGALTLEELEKSYEDKLSEVRREESEALRDLANGYIGALSRIETNYRKSGRLDEVLLVRDEIKAISERKWPLGVLPEKISLETADPRKIYIKNRIKIEQEAASREIEAADKMLAALDRRVKLLTQSGEIEEALLARQIIADVGKEEGLLAARKLMTNVASDGRARAALRIRRYGDNIEVLVRYDMRGKVSMESPVSNVKESDKNIGDSRAETLGQFVGAEGNEVDPFVIFDKTFDSKDQGSLRIHGFESEFRKEFSGEAALIIKPVVDAKNPLIGIPAEMIPLSLGGTTRITARYFVPETNESLQGFKFIQGSAGGAPFGRKEFLTRGKWVTEVAESAATSEDTNLLMYISRDKTQPAAHVGEDKVIYGRLKVEILRFPAFIVQRLGENGEVVESYDDPSKQPLFISNGAFKEER